MTAYGETMRFEDGVYDLGGVCDETLFWLREEMESNLASPQYYSFLQQRDEDQESLENIEDEIYWRFRNGGSLDEDLDNSWWCGLGCC
jgi:hypothetical protein